MYEKEYSFIFEVWEIVTNPTMKTIMGGKLVGTKEIKLSAEDDKIAIKKAWNEVNESLTHSYFYRLVVNK
jgi:hypothetical protein